MVNFIWSITETVPSCVSALPLDSRQPVQSGIPLPRTHPLRLNRAAVRRSRKVIETIVKYPTQNPCHAPKERQRKF